MKKNGAIAKPNRPDPAELRELHSAADEFFRLKPWKWMYDSHLFGFQSPESRKFGFVCVMGAANQVFGLCVYRGAQGLQSFLDLHNGKLAPPNTDLQTMHNALLVTHDPASSFEKLDREDSVSAGFPLKRGKKHPLFRSFRPGFVPWHLTSPEARFFATAIRQTVDMAKRLQAEPDLLDRDPNVAILVRQSTTPDGSAWKDTWVKPHFPADEPENSPPPITEDLIESIRNLPGSTEAWEFDFRFLPIVLSNSPEPHRYPRLVIIADFSHGKALHGNVLEPTAEMADAGQELISFIQSVGRLPGTITVKRSELAGHLAPLRKLNITINLVEAIPPLEDLANALSEAQP